jgi:hypothetical protein
MQLNIHRVITLLWGGSVLAQLALCWFMARNGEMKRFPKFFGCNLYGIGKSVLLLYMTLSPAFDGKDYFFAYWSTNAAAAFIGLAVVREVFLLALKPFDGLRDLGGMAFKWCASLMAIIAALVALRGHAPSELTAVIPSIVSNFASSVNLLQVGMLLLLFFVSKKLSISVLNRLYGVALGMGIYAAMNMFSQAMFMGLNQHQMDNLNLFRMCIGLTTNVIWLVYFARPVAVEERRMLPIASPLMRWNEVAMALGNSPGRVLYTNSPEPFLPQMERLVDQVLAKQRSTDR